MTALPTNFSAGLFRTAEARRARKTEKLGFWSSLTLIVSGVIAAFATDIPGENEDSYMAY